MNRIVPEICTTTLKICLHAWAAAAEDFAVYEGFSVLLPYYYPFNLAFVLC